MSTPMSMIVLVATTLFFWLTARTLYREIKTGVPHLFFSPHPAFRNRAGNRKQPYLWFTVAFRIVGTLGLALMVFTAVLFLLESLNLIY
ncbi:MULTISPECIES: hypothetical protein [Citromicrobium]|uniref:hypothetical protein n=1 Tax=Citromicrobium TaxID=72173 RepID=UPI0001DD0484|nr:MULTISPECIES: hypothetical protein [Citromicrobium]ALG60328.1 hypothetical protein WG74_05265 [Citromicrobium sp. JL477]KPM18998.1 hypothetical protein VO58_02635 [Citromicrobium sp. JL1351]KPM20545.1 hypothetical protein VM77_02290 [Citromicrobium sp. JL31]KPM29986.1 hypothetical protein VO57_02635 [Citromicrobium sp. JL2201]